MPEVQPFGVKFSEGINYLKGKLPEVSLTWDSLAGPVHGKVFTVAGATSVGLVSDLHQSLTSAIDNGTTIADFRKDFDKTVAKHGWSYRGNRSWRTRVIFDSNMRSATMAGRWAQIWQGRERRPFLQYRTAGDSKVRPAHRRWNGIIRAVTDAFWQVFYPPNGWLCRCTVRSYSQAEVDSKGLTIDTEPFDSPTRVVRKKGAPTDIVPVGVDAGWDHNVGISWMAPEIALGRKLVSLPPKLRDAMIEKTISPQFQRVLADGWKDFRKAVKATPQAGATKVVGFFDGPTTSALQAIGPEAMPPSIVVGAAAEDLAAMSWPSKMLDDLPIHLRNYQAVLWDTEAKAVVVIPFEAVKAKDGRLHTITIQAATEGPAKGGMAVRAAGRSRIRDLADSNRFKVLVGRVD